MLNHPCELHLQKYLLPSVFPEINVLIPKLLKSRLNRRRFVVLNATMFYETIHPGPQTAKKHRGQIAFHTVE
jgi:hypothetical protein